MPELDESLELFGAWATPLDAIGHGWFVMGHYLLGARCSTGCHIAMEVMDPEIWGDMDKLEQSFREAFRRVHPPEESVNAA